MTWKNIYRMSAIVGQDWRPKTLRELVIQWEQVLVESWHHTANIKGMLASKKVKYERLHPYLSEAQTGIKIEAKSLFVEDLGDGIYEEVRNASTSATRRGPVDTPEVPPHVQQGPHQGDELAEDQRIPDEKGRTPGTQDHEGFYPPGDDG